MPKFKILCQRVIHPERPDPGTFVALHPTGESQRNLEDWSRRYGLAPIHAPYGVMHVTTLATARTVAIHPASYEPAITIPGHRIRLETVEYRPGRRALVASLFDDELEAVINMHHRKAAVKRDLSVQPHLTIAYTTRWGDIPRGNLPFTITLRKQTVSGLKSHS